MKKIFRLLVLSFVLAVFYSLPNLAFAQYTKVFKISAYYSPLPCQSVYATGSYEGDIRLNGRGTNGADGTEVYAGMVAAPKAYAFGTKMYIPGIGTTAVHDRGGAILSSDESGNTYDRLDIWMGYGEPGLQRALNWGKRDVEVTVYGIDSSILESVSLPGYSPEEGNINYCSDEYIEPVSEVVFTEEYKESVKEEYSTVDQAEIESDLFFTALKKGDEGAEVLKLQKELASLNFYKANFTSVYDDLTVHAVFKFQQSQALVVDELSVGAGFLGPQTRSRLNEIITMREVNLDIIAKANDKTYLVDAYINTEMDFGLVSEEVEKLQEFLADQGYFMLSYTSNYFGEDTQNALIQFQIDQGIIDSATDLGAGRVGPATLALINQLA